MRLIGTLSGEKEAYRFYSFLKQEGINCAYEPVFSSEMTFEFWVMHEDQIEIALHWLEEFKKNPDDPRFETKPHPIDTEGVAAKAAAKEPLEIRAFRLRQKKHRRTPLTRFFILLCAILYLWDSYQMYQLVEKAKARPEIFTLTPLVMNLSYDMPNAISPEALSQELFSKEKIGSPKVWDGLYGVALYWPEAKSELAAPMFVKIREGEIWRLITPCFLHGSFLHILFNMLWLWLLGRQIEERTKKWQYLTITIIIGIVSNTFQYLMSGPLFIGYSGIISGLAGYIWMREKRAPWEGYPLSRGNLYFLGIFILSMLGLQVVSFILTRFHIAQFNLDYIANTAHITGALTGMALGRIPLFSKGVL